MRRYPGSASSCAGVAQNRLNDLIKEARERAGGKSPDLTPSPGCWLAAAGTRAGVTPSDWRCWGHAWPRVSVWLQEVRTHQGAPPDPVPLAKGGLGEGRAGTQGMDPASSPEVPYTARGAAWESSPWGCSEEQPSSSSFDTCFFV